MSFLLPFVYRSICWQIFFKTVFLKSFANFTRNHLCKNPILVKLQTGFAATLSKRDSNTGVFFLQNISGGCFCVNKLDPCLLNETDMQRLRHRYFPVNFAEFLEILLITSGDWFFLSQDA